jgi:hypothetical protein
MMKKHREIWSSKGGSIAKKEEKEPVVAPFDRLSRPNTYQ